MTQLLFLLQKEWRLRSKPVLISLALTLAAGMVSWFYAGDITSMIGVLIAPAIASLVLFAVLLAGSFTSEWQQNTHYQLLALPISPSLIAIAKYLYYLLAGLLMLGILSFCLAFSSSEQTQVTTALPGSGFSIVLLALVCYYLSILSLLLGVSLFSQAYTIGRASYRGILSKSLLLLLLSATALLAVPITSLMDGLGYYEIDINGAYASLTEISFYPAFFIYATLAGLTFTLAGLYLFQRRMDL